MDLIFIWNRTNQIKPLCNQAANLIDFILYVWRVNRKLPSTFILSLDYFAFRIEKYFVLWNWRTLCPSRFISKLTFLIFMKIKSKINISCVVIIKLLYTLASTADDFSPLKFYCIFWLSPTDNHVGNQM